MKKITNLLDKKICRDYIRQNPTNIEEFIDVVKSISNKWEKNKTISQLKIIVKLAKKHTNLREVYQEYSNCDSVKRKIELCGGKDKVVEYTNKLASKSKPKVVSILTTDYWTSKGYTEEEAKNTVSEIQRKNAKKRTKNSYQNFSKKVKYSIDYWTDKGYSREEAELLRTPYLSKCKNDLPSLIQRYGEEKGLLKHITRVAKYKKSVSDNFCNRKSGGYVSKESLKFFIPLYKFCRRLGIKREDIYLGVNGSREFFIKDNSVQYNTGKFYDFTIKSLKIIVEYNGIYWHPRKIEEWRNPADYNTALDADLYKEKLAKNFGMDYYIIWSDECKKEAFIKITRKIEEKYNAQH